VGAGGSAVNLDQQRTCTRSERDGHAKGKMHGCIVPQGRPDRNPPPVTHAPNDLWTADFKGHFRTRDGIYCYPLTIADLHTRYLLTCRGLLTTKGVGVRASLEQAFRTYGLSRAIRTDNGVPSATTGIHGLSQLNVWRVCQR
jgi:transposase InsO family protein